MFCSANSNWKTSVNCRVFAPTSADLPAFAKASMRQFISKRLVALQLPTAPSSISSQNEP